MKKFMMTCVVASLGLTVALPASAEFKTRNIRISNGLSSDHPVGDGVKAFNSCLQEKSDGKMKLTAYWSESLGSDIQATQALRSGTQEAVITSSSPLVGLVPALGVFDLPFLFANEQEADQVVDGAFGEVINGKLEEQGLVNLAFWENGFRQLTNSKRPVEKWEDFKGIKVRVMQNNIFLDTFNNLGANPTPMAFGEIFSALETGAIDAQENPFVTIDASKFYEVQKYVSVTNHAYTPFLVLYSKRIFDTYSDEEKAALQECAVVGRDEQRKAIRTLTAQSIETIKAAGVEVNELSADEQQRIREKSQPIYDKHQDDVGVDVVEQVQKQLSEIRG
ncbi:TRAP transporter substrate-binding protein [Paenalcaligenes niemegkensis]|uniref:TRAP transporter substrate-binding protein n=1 Tax=Paenalcaligenes niemegkensis TaxID=2895469 RepID=UPI001EE795D9|nr:TRAP transporter substrate-binding protein [Paenalcaligenes niemegkensis]MCQ9618330.1 TRAP transporter substrate-binding protein [Paenalcaligenes niemegkensis]